MSENEYLSDHLYAYRQFSQAIIPSNQNQSTIISCK